jgi:HSP20 family protein
MSEATKKAKISQPEALAPRAPFGKVSRLEQDIERVFNDFWRRPFLSLWGPDHWWPARSLSLQMPVVDVYEEKDDVVVKAEIPGLSKEDIEVTLTESSLTIQGEKKKEEEIKEKNYYCSERSSGSFARRLELPVEVKTDQAKASFKDGILKIRLPKTDEAKKRRVKVKID